MKFKFQNTKDLKMAHSRIFFYPCILFKFNFRLMNFFFILPFFFLLRSDITIRAASIDRLDLKGEYHKLIEDVPGILTSIPLISDSRYNFLIEYFEADPKACLAGVNEIGDYAFDELFFNVIGRMRGYAGSVFLLFYSTGSSFTTFLVLKNFVRR